MSGTQFYEARATIELFIFWALQRRTAICTGKYETSERMTCL